MSGLFPLNAAAQSVFAFAIRVLGFAIAVCRAPVDASIQRLAAIFLGWLVTHLRPAIVGPAIVAVPSIGAVPLEPALEDSGRAAVFRFVGFVSQLRKRPSFAPRWLRFKPSAASCGPTVRVFPPDGFPRTHREFVPSSEAPNHAVSTE